MQCSYTRLTIPSVKNVVVLTRSSITEIWPSAVKPTSNWTPLVSKQNKVNYAPTLLNVSTTKAITWLTTTNALIGDIGLIENGTIEIGCSLPPRKHPPQLFSHNSFTSLNSRY